MSVPSRCENGCGYCQRKTKVLGGKPVSVPLCSPQIPHRLPCEGKRSSVMRRLRRVIGFVVELMNAGLLTFAFCRKRGKKMKVGLPPLLISSVIRSTSCPISYGLWCANSCVRWQIGPGGRTQEQLRHNIRCCLCPDERCSRRFQTA